MAMPKPPLKRAALARPYIRAELPGWGSVMRWSGIRGGSWAEAPTKTIRGKRHKLLMELDLSHWSQRYTYFLGRYHETAMLSLLAKLLRPGDRVVDVGANIGMITLECAAAVGPTGLVDAIEPNGLCCDRIQRQIALNQLGHVRVHSVALSDTPGSLTLSIPSGDPGKGTLATLDAGLESVPQIKVDVVVGDSLLGKAERPPTLIKIDVEGYEPHALRGLAQTLRIHKPILITEVNRHWLERAGSSVAELFSLLHEFTYVGSTIDVRRGRFGRPLKLEPATANIESANVVWVQPTSPMASRLAPLLPDLSS